MFTEDIIPGKSLYSPVRCTAVRGGTGVTPLLCPLPGILRALLAMNWISEMPPSEVPKTEVWGLGHACAGHGGRNRNTKWCFLFLGITGCSLDVCATAKHICHVSSATTNKQTHMNMDTPWNRRPEGSGAQLSAFCICGMTKHHTLGLK